MAGTREFTLRGDDDSSYNASYFVPQDMAVVQEAASEMQDYHGRIPWEADRCNMVRC